MRAGQLDTLCQFYRRSDSTTRRGEPVYKYVKVGQEFWASISSVGRERPENYQEDQFIAIKRREFRCYWRSGILAGMWIKVLETGEMYKVELVDPLGRKAGMSIIAVTRGDQECSE